MSEGSHQKPYSDNEKSNSKDRFATSVVATSVESEIAYRLYKRRFAGLTALIVLNVVAGMTYPWFGPISNAMVAEFGITLDETNWLGNIMACVYLPVALAVPVIVSRLGLRRCCDIGAACLLISAWIRYSGTIRSLPDRSAYGLLILGQIFAAVAQPIFQILGPKYSETWFDLRGRTTATMIVSIANPIGGAIGQLLSPLVGDTRQSILVLGIISTVAAPFVLLMARAPPIPPTYSGSQPSQSIGPLAKAMLGKETTVEAHLTRRERFDFAIIVIVFGTLVGVTTAFSILTAQILMPYGYSSDTAGFMGATLLLSGIVAAAFSSPLSDRVFTHHLGLTIKVLVPVVAAGWLSLIWAVRANNTAALYALMAVIGVTSITILPLALELACDITKNADGSSAMMWFSANLFCIIFVLVADALRASPEALPSLNMHRSLIFIGAFCIGSSSLIFGLNGYQTRKMMDTERYEEYQARQRAVEA